LGFQPVDLSHPNDAARLPNDRDRKPTGQERFMKAEIRRKLSMAVRVVDFAQAHPSTDPSYTGVVTRLQDRLTRADVLARQQRESSGGEHASVARRDELQQTILQPKLRHLVRIAEVAMRDHPELAGIFVPPRANTPHKVFITAAKSMLAAALAQKDLFVSLGLGSTFLDEFSQALAEFDQRTQEAHAGRRGHVGARADLTAVCDECTTLATLLGGLNRDRFRADPELLAAWQSARNVIGPFRSKQGTAPAPAPAPAPTPANGGTVPPASGNNAAA
jgi:hypothetical protein